MGVAGQKTELPSKASCDRSYWMVQNTQLYWALQNTWRYPTAQNYVTRVLQEAPDAKTPLHQQLAVLTHVAKGGSSYFVAEELAITLRMHVVLLGRNFQKLKAMEESIRREAQRRRASSLGANNKDKLKETKEKSSIKIYKVKFDCDSVSSILEAAEDVKSIAIQENENYQGKISILMHNPSGLTASYATTQDEVEVNLGRNYIAPHLLTQQLLPLLKAASTPTYKPRIVSVSSVGHCQGTDFDPELFLDDPEEGGAPEGTFREPTEKEKEEEGDKMIYVEGIDAAVRMYYRSKMALIADTIALSKDEPSLSVTSVYPGSVVTRNSKSQGIAGSLYQTGFFMFNLNPTQGARASLRAAIDPDFNTVESLQGCYLHCDGNPWTVADPTVEDPVTDVSYLLGDYASKVRECTEELCERLVRQCKSRPVTTAKQEDNVEGNKPIEESSTAADTTAAAASPTDGSGTDSNASAEAKEPAKPLPFHRWE